MVFGGQSASLGGTSTVTESWNGSTWTEVNDLVGAKKFHGGSVKGTSTAALAFGGSDGTARIALTETWNGTSWAEVSDMNATRSMPGGAGTNTAGLAFCGDQGATFSQATEEWVAPALTTVTFTVS